MSESPPKEVDEPLDEQTLEAALTFLLGEAHDQGVEVVQNWSCETHDDLPDWEVQVWETSSPTENEAAIEEYQ